jgi:hypothetical protein
VAKNTVIRSPKFENEAGFQKALQEADLAWHDVEQESLRATHPIPNPQVVGGSSLLLIMSDDNCGHPFIERLPTPHSQQDHPPLQSSSP